jgi:hypothetical protein
VNRTTTCDICRHWTGRPNGITVYRDWGVCRSGKHIATSWASAEDETALIHHVEGGCDCATSVIQTGPKYGCIHFCGMQS